MSYNSIVDYALWYYYMTGYRRAWDVAMMNGEFLLRWNAPTPLDPGDGSNLVVSSQRNGMGRGAMAITLYRATHDNRYLALAEKQMKYFRDHTDEETEQQPGFHHIFYAPFVERYWEVTRDPTLKPYLIKWARGWVHHLSLVLRPKTVCPRSYRSTITWLIFIAGQHTSLWTKLHRGGQ